MERNTGDEYITNKHVLDSKSTEEHRCIQEEIVAHVTPSARDPWPMQIAPDPVSLHTETERTASRTDRPWPAAVIEPPRSRRLERGRSKSES